MATRGRPRRRKVLIRQRNAEFMTMTHHKVGVVTRWKADLDTAADEVSQMWGALNVDSLDRNNPQALRDFADSLPEKLEALVKEKKTPLSGDADRG